MSKKIEQCLALAFNNSSKEEATRAFGQAFAYAMRDGLKLGDFRGKGAERVVIKEKVVYRDRPGTGAPLSAAREKELVDKYNAVLGRAKELKAELESSQEELITAYVQRNNFSRRVDELNRQISELKDNGGAAELREVEKLAMQRANLIDQLQQELKGVKQTLSERIQIGQRLTARHEELLESYRRVSNEAQRWQSQAEEYKARAERQKQEIEELRRSRTSGYSDEEIRDLKSDMEILRIELQAARDVGVDYAFDLEMAEAQLATKEAMIAQLNKNVAAEHGEALRMADALTEAARSRDSFKMMLDANTAALASTQKHLANEQEKSAALTRELKEKNYELEEARAIIAKLRGFDL